MKLSSPAGLLAGLRSALSLVLFGLLLSSTARAQEGQAPALVPPQLAAEPHGHPDYPSEADGAAARVTVEITIDEAGAVTDATVVESDRTGSDAGLFETAAVAYVRTLTFRPAERDGVPVRSQIRFEVFFEPQEPPPHQHEHAPAAHEHDEHTHDEHRHEDHEDREPHTHDPEPPAPEPDLGGAFGATAEVQAGVRGPNAVAASDFELELGALRDVPRRTAADMLTLAPGVVLQNHSGEGHAPTVFLRGFDAGEGQDIELLVDGVPLNEPSNAHGHGYADSHFLIPELVSSIRVLEGPFDPRQGDFAVAGSAEYRLAAARRGITLGGSYGSFREARALLLWAPANAADETFVGVDVRGGDGFGPNRAHRSFSAIGQYASQGGPLRWSVMLASSALEFDSAGVIREDAFESRSLPCATDEDEQFFCLHDPNQGGSGSRHLINARLEHRGASSELSQQLFASIRKHRIRENFTGALLDPIGDGLDQLTDTTTVGGRGRYRIEQEWLGREHALEVGYVARHDLGETRLFRLRQDGGAPYQVVFDTDLQVTNVGAYILGETHPLPWLSASVGARVDAFAYQLIDRDRPTMDRDGDRLPTEPVDAFGLAVQPRGTVRFHLTDGLAIVTSVGLGARSTDAQALSEGEDAPFAEVLAGELGLTFADSLADWGIEARAFGFYTRVDNDLLFDEERGRNVPIGPSQRVGASAFGRIRGSWLDALASVTWSEAYEGGDVLDFSGPRLAFVPRFVVRLDAAVRHEVPIYGEGLRLGASVGTTYISEKPLPLGTESEPIFAFDTALRAGWRFIDVAFEIENLFDVRNRAAEFNYVSSFGPAGSLQRERHFAAGPPRTVLFTISFHLDTQGVFAAQ
ncbi:MAG: TonB-dependent receptor [Myxococcota bacterium]